MPIRNLLKLIAMVYFLGADRLEIRTKLKFQKLTELIKKENQNLKIYVKLDILSTKIKT